MPGRSTQSGSVRKQPLELGIEFVTLAEAKTVREASSNPRYRDAQHRDHPLPPFFRQEDLIRIQSKIGDLTRCTSGSRWNECCWPLLPVAAHRIHGERRQAHGDVFRAIFLGCGIA